MSYATEHIAATLKAARKGKGLSQRALSKLVGVPQSHISKIETGSVDLRVSSLVELARFLDLELTLVPRKAVAAVNSIVRTERSAAPSAGETLRAGRKEIKRLQDTLAGLSAAGEAAKEFARIQRQARELSHFTLNAPALEAIRQAQKTVQAFKDHTSDLDTVRQAAAQLQSLRIALAHGSASAPQIANVRPAYSLDEGDDA